MLLQQGADVNAKDRFHSFALMQAVFYGHLETARVLVEKGADVNLTDDTGKTALVLARQKKLPPLADLLKKNGAME